MQSPIITWLRGSVCVEIKGKDTDGFLNAVLSRSLHVWDIRYQGANKIQLEINVSDFFKLRPILRRTGCRVHVTARRGAPFVLEKMSRRKVFLGGIAAFVIALYMLTSLVWQVSITGNDKISDTTILEAAAKQGVYRFQWKFRLKDTAELAKQLQASLPETSWVGIEMKGTHLHIQVVEARIPEKKPLRSPRNLVASKNALVTEILTTKGKPLVKPQMYVRQGDVLISGYIGDENHSQIVVAEGKVRGIVWYTSNIESPLTRQYKVLTGESKSRNYLVIGSRALKLSGFGDPPFNQYETNVKRSTLQWRNFSLPIGWMSEKLMDMRVIEQSIDVDQAREMAIAQARQELLSQTGADSRIISQKILHEKTESGKVYMEVHFEVEENIAQEQPIVTQGE
ncbi:sporulation protein YqfD [Paenibacillus sp. N1-5-1-14]|uniref:sporulation protein YqfD n=1 Tax=Paenibacillus radicibacter TaxID=2972488 RepID=UPI002158CD61|nr:sporulation protein YqfD [Paenibacillus radicibacter]MCR8641977.1 sporulation protein YqfD [Paenibacillus radicibacter]